MNHLISYPRSGRNMVRVAFDRLGPHFISLDMGGQTKLGIEAQTIEDRLLTSCFSEDRPIAEATHDVKQVKEGDKVVILIRDPRDAIVSRARQYETQGWNFVPAMDMLITTRSWITFYEQLADALEAHLITDFQYFRYEDLVEASNLQAHLFKMLDVWDVMSTLIQTDSNPLEEQFEDTNKMMPQFFRRGKIGSYKDEMSLYFQDRVIGQCEDWMQRFKYL